MSGWDGLDEALEQSGGSGNIFINLEDGESVTGVIVGQPHLEAIFWTGATYIPWVDSEREEDDKKAFQLSTNFYDMPGANMRVLQGKAALMIALRETLEKYGKDTGRTLPSGKPEKTLAHRVFEIKRTGEKAKTRFSLFLEPDISAPDREKMGELHDLKVLASRCKGADIKQDSEDDDQKPRTQVDTDLPF